MVEPHPLPLLLASGSPRRRMLLAGAGVDFEIQPAAIEENALPGEQPAALAARLAEAKAQAVARAAGATPPRIVLGADTIVVLGDRIFGKPTDDAHAVELLEQLLGHTHRVITAVALVDSGSFAVRRACVESRVSMRAADREEICRYVATGESSDKAGAYALQGEGSRFIERVEGSQSNVIGLPLDETLELLRAAGLRCGAT